MLTDVEASGFFSGVGVLYLVVEGLEEAGLVSNSRAFLYTDGGFATDLGCGLLMGRLPERGSEMGEKEGAIGVRASFSTLCLLGVAFGNSSMLVAVGLFSRSDEGEGDDGLRRGLLVSGESDGRF